MVEPAAKGLPSLTRQSSTARRLNILGFTRTAEANVPHLKWILEMEQPRAHAFVISTMKDCIPLGRVPALDCAITISPFEQFVSAATTGQHHCKLKIYVILMYI
ncbi:hypothetical protein PVL29_001421 [Vitis rotundifolia]|uniref:Uncharacterized protein n=1 Tax=Vitis rotundifolia TaxID=103349 RepID=A0AA39E6E7_VITRO|nr:hypothetical protein PVL29_001421 [Vitis rotundifolia]